MLKYNICTKLKKAGFPQTFEVGESHYFIGDGGEVGIALTTENIGDWDDVAEDEGWIKIPTLSELMGACKIRKQDRFEMAKHRDSKKWHALVDGYLHNGCDVGSTPEEAVSHLFLKIQKFKQ